MKIGEGIVSLERQVQEQGIEYDTEVYTLILIADGPDGLLVSQLVQSQSDEDAPTLVVQTLMMAVNMMMNGANDGQS